MTIQTRDRLGGVLGLALAGIAAATLVAGPVRGHGAEPVQLARVLPAVTIRAACAS